MRRTLQLALAAAVFIGGGLPFLQSDALASERQDAGPGRFVELLEAGRAFHVETTRGALVLRPGDWSYPSNDSPIVFEGRYNPESGIWSSDSVSFRITNNEYHGCPPDIDRSRFICGGSHSDGYRMTRRFSPADNMIVVLGNELRFDDMGNVYRQDELIGKLTVPASCDANEACPTPMPAISTESSLRAATEAGAWIRLRYYHLGPTLDERRRIDYWISSDDYGQGPDAEGRVQVRMISLGNFDESFQPTWINDSVIGIDCVNRSRRSIDADGPGEWVVLPDFVPGAETVFAMCSPNRMKNMPSAPDLDTALTQSRALERFRAEASKAPPPR